MNVPPPPAVDLEAYFARIGYAGPRTSNAAVLQAMHRAHRGSIPFENLDILLGRTPSLDLPNLEAKLVAGRRGGYCFEQNTLFAAVLEALGYRVERLIGRVLSGAPSVPRPRTHMMLAVEADGGEWLCDVGFGAWGILDPVPLAVGGHSQDGWLVELRESAGLWTLSCPQYPSDPVMYVFDRQPQIASDYEMANFYTACHPTSQFRRAPTAQIAWPHERLIIRNGEFHTVRLDGTITVPIEGPEQLLGLLRERFGLSFPAGTRFELPA
ncbi:MAG: arylamine N-acetyltransferase [Verrucomicrobia bacterium]|nr:arylamine N-acetyltransferase [Verrucomicrobiota bacterium]